MAARLYRLGRTAYRHPREVCIAWALLLLLAIAAAASIGGTPRDEFTVPGAEAQDGIELLAERFPEVSGAAGRVVFAAPDGASLAEPELAAAVQEAVRNVGRAPQVVAAIDPAQVGTISPDGRIAFAQVQYAVPYEDVEDASRAAVQDAVQVARDAGLAVEVGGEAFAEVPGGSHVTEVLGLAVAVVVLLVTFGSVLAAGLPLLMAFVGVGVGLAGLTVAAGLTTVNSTASVLALMIGLAVGIDYTLFLVSRHRQQLAEGLDPEESAARAVATAGSAVVFAGLTVLFGLAGLAVVGVPFLTVMGLSASLAVVLAVLVAITLLPAVLGFAGARVGRGRPVRTDEGTFGARWARAVTARPKAAVLVVLVALGTVAVPALDLRLGLLDDGALPERATQRQAFDLVETGFGPGFNGPLLVVVEGAGPGAATAAAVEVGAGISELPGVVLVAPPTANATDDTALLTVIPAGGPASEQTEQLVSDLRAAAPALGERTGTTLLVTGQTALQIDVADRLAEALPVFAAVVVGLALLLLTLLFRSITVPVKAAAGFLLSIAAALGAVVAVFQWGWLGGVLGIEETGVVVSFLPVLLIGVLFGLAMDYEVFLVSRMREEHAHGAAPLDAVVTGFRHSARVVTAAGLIMVSVFSGFVLSDDVIVRSIGFAMAFGILVDAFLVRMTLGPAVMALLGRHSWYLPRWLDRVLPQVDVEGANLQPVEPYEPAPADTPHELVGAGR